MKKFITTIPALSTNLKEGVYEAFNNENLKSDIITSFPVLPLIKGYCESDEKIEIIVIYTDDEKCFNEKLGENTSVYAYNKFKEQAETFLQGIDYTINEITIKLDERIECHLDTFTKIIEQINNGDTIYTDISYGTKPIPIIQIMALNYALRVMKNVKVECLCYGGVNFSNGAMSIYDVTSLLYMDEFVNGISKTNTKNPLEVIKELIKLSMN